MRRSELNLLLLIGCLISLLFPGINSASTRTYYIAAEEILWDYAPSYPQDPMHGMSFKEAQDIFLRSDPQSRIGHRYYKAHYVEYTDASFTHLKERPPEWEHLGILGPVIRANVGDEIRVILKNSLKDHPVSMHPHGVFYSKRHEGTHYADGTGPEEKRDDMIEPGEQFTYEWSVPERSGPGPQDPSSIVWLYHSHVDEVADTNAGLIGAIIISRKGFLQNNGKLKGIDREFVVLFSVMDENKSWLLDKNMGQMASLNIKPDDPEFVESNLMHSMNGFVYSNIKGLVMNKGEKVRWYQIALGTEVDLHTPHWHGNTLTETGKRVDVLNLLPGTHITVDMTPDNPGTWMYHCHVNDHIEAGMMGSYLVRDNPQNKAAKEALKSTH